MPTERQEVRELRFTFDERRTVQACAVLIGKIGACENYTKLIKLLYLADRRSLLETGQTITGSSFVCMANGPVLSDVYTCIKDEPSDSWWDKHLAKRGYDLELTKDPGDDRLSDYDVELLSGLAAEHRYHDVWAMVDIVHQLKEWCHPSPAKVRSLSPTSVMLLAGESPDVINALADQQAYFAEVEHALSS